ncbi:protein PET100 homolog, mitochondrial-like [Pollicipes pollicipes]|uniref:protein PET100 homolog, mitochondrial-like n=1 Tax=Pollicipes pollicipes TaxID=41117 RepID=UPI0018854C32|nr:protein PET100 homolog, mitochondrial-like [Pollicipes pollicipes]
MGGWKLEVFKMGMYMTFPVGLFWYFNQPEYFEKWVIQTKQQLYPPSTKTHRDELETFKKEYHHKKTEEFEKQLLEAEKH